MIIFFIKAVYIVNWISLIAAIIIDILAICNDEWDDMCITTKKKLLLNIILPFYFMWPTINRVLTDWYKKLKQRKIRLMITQQLITAKGTPLRERGSSTLPAVTNYKTIKMEEILYITIMLLIALYFGIKNIENHKTK